MGIAYAWTGGRRLSIPLPEPLPDPVVDLHVRRADGAFLALGRSGVVQISSDDGATWTPTCTLPGLRRSGRPEAILSSAEVGLVLAQTDRLYIVDQAVGDAGPCRYLPMPNQAASIDQARLSKNRILVRADDAYFTSDNLGQSWAKLAVEWNPDPNAPGARDSSLALDPGNPERISLLTCEQTDATDPDARRAVIRSRSIDATSFSALVTSLPCDGTGETIAFERDSPGVLYIVSGTSAFVSVDGGNTWYESLSAAIPSIAMPEGGFVRMDIAPPSTPTSTLLAHFRHSPGGREGVFSQKGSVAVNIVPGAKPVLQGGKGRYLFSWGVALFASLDGGATFKSIAPLSSRFFSPLDVASRDGKTLWSVDAGWRVAVSVDGGATWSLRYAGPSGQAKSPVHPRIYVHPYNDSSLLLHEEEFDSTYERFRIATADGFQKADARDVEAFNGWASAIGFLAADSASHYLAGRNTAVKGTATTDKPVELPSSPGGDVLWAPFPDLLSLPAAPNKYFFGENGNGKNPRYESYDVVSGAKNDLLAALNMSPAGHVIAHATSGPRLRVISEVGQIRESSDGLTFSDLGGTPSLEKCDRRLLSVLGSNTNRMATACLGAKAEPSVTSDAGKTWTKLPGADLDGCDVTQIVVTASKVLTACGGARKVLEFTK